MIIGFAIIFLASTIVFAFFPKFSWYYVLSGKWGTNGLGVPSEANILCVRMVAIIPIIAYRCLILAI